MTEPTPRTLVLGVGRAGLEACVSCGLCLPHCPTFRITGDEASSPRGRIAAMRSVEAGEVDVDDARLAEILHSCVGCRGCEVACPSGVPYGDLLAGARAALAHAGRPAVGVRHRAAMAVLGRRRLLRAASLVLAVAQRVGAAGRLPVPPRLPLRRRRLRGTGRDVVLFTGCVMDAWQRDVHADTVAVLGLAGVGVEPAPRSASCCGALHHHAGADGGARRRAGRVVAALGGDDRPIVVNSAGCGAMLAELGSVLGTEDARRVSARVVDLHTLLAQLDLPAGGDGTLGRVAVSDACHLRATGGAGAVHAVMSRVLGDVVDLDDDGLCCGAGGFYSVTRPADAEAIRRRKLASIARAGADVVVSANPGCVLHLQAGGADARHPIQVLAVALGVSEGARRRDTPRPR